MSGFGGHVSTERLYPDRLPEHVHKLAHHAFRGEVWEKAVAYCRQAGGKATSRSAYREAATYFEQALIALARHPETRETIEQDIDLRCELRSALFPLGDHERIFKHLSAAESLASSLNDQARLGRVLGYLSTQFVNSAEHVRALDVSERALSIAMARGDAAEETEARFRLSLVQHMLGDYSKAIDLGRKVVKSVAHDVYSGVALTSVVARFWLGWGLAERGGFPEAITLAEEAVRLAEGAGSYSQAIGHLALGLVRVHKGDLQGAIPPVERGVRVYAEVAVFLPLTTSYMGSAYVLSGRMVEGLPLLEQAVEQAASAARCWHSPVVINLGQGYLLAGRLENAMSLAESALELTRERKECGFEARALWLLAEITAHPDHRDVAMAARQYGAAMQRADELGMRPLVAHCHLGLGKLYRRTGKRQEAQEHLTTATTMYREMDMGFYLTQAEAALAASGQRAGR